MPFENACSAGYLDIAQWLYELGEKINCYANNKSNYSAFQYAMMTIISM
jgi:hypothetical protein